MSVAAAKARPLPIQTKAEKLLVLRRQQFGDASRLRGCRLGGDDRRGHIRVSGYVSVPVRGCSILCAPRRGRRENSNRDHPLSALKTSLLFSLSRHLCHFQIESLRSDWSIPRGGTKNTREFTCMLISLPHRHTAASQCPKGNRKQASRALHSLSKGTPGRCEGRF